MIGIIRKEGFFLLSQRKQHVHLGGLWEFPGGKVEAGEDLISALQRELFEEIGIEVINATPFMLIEHDYPDFKVNLHFFLVDKFKAEPYGKEGQRIEWVHQRDLSNYAIPAANLPVIGALNDL